MTVQPDRAIRPVTLASAAASAAEGNRLRGAGEITFDWLISMVRCGRRRRGGHCVPAARALLDVRVIRFRCGAVPPGTRGSWRRTRFRALSVNVGFRRLDYNG